MSANGRTIVRAAVGLGRIPVVPPRGDAMQKFTALELPLVELTDGSGNTGIGFGYTIGTGGSAAIQLLRETLVPELHGADSACIRKLHWRLTKSIHALTPGCLSSMALAAVDIALWDLEGKRAGLPLAVLLGGVKSAVPVYTTDVGWIDRPEEEVVELSRDAIRQRGFGGVKLKLGRSPEEDEARVAHVRQAIGDHIPLMLDANQSWTVGEAVRRLAMLERYRPYWIEEPLPAGDVQGYTALGSRTMTPRAGGESIYSAAGFYQLLRAGALDILQPDIVRVGGITPALEISGMAHAAGVPVAFHVPPELSVSLAAAIPHSLFIEYVPQMEPGLEAVLEVKDGAARPFPDPGHGVRFNEGLRSAANMSVVFE